MGAGSLELRRSVVVGKLGVVESRERSHTEVQIARTGRLRGQWEWRGLDQNLGGIIGVCTYHHRQAWTGIIGPFGPSAAVPRSQLASLMRVLLCGFRGLCSVALCCTTRSMARKHQDHRTPVLHGTVQSKTDVGSAGGEEWCAMNMPSC